MKNLSLFNVDNNDHLVQPYAFCDTHLSSPALDLFNDFKFNAPTVIDSQVSAMTALEIMKYENSRLKLVIDQHHEMIGLLTMDCLADEAILRRVAHGDHRNEIKVMDLMIPRYRLKAVAYSQLANCTIGDVVDTMKASGVEHCLVVDRHSHHIRGVVSAEDISKRLHIPVNVQQRPTFLNVVSN